MNDIVRLNNNIPSDVGIRITTEDNRMQMLNEEVRKNEKLLNYAVFSIALLNDIACGAITDLENKLMKNKSVYRFKVKSLFSILKGRRKEYTRLFNKALKSDIGRFCDSSDIYNEEVLPHYQTLRMQFYQECLRLRLPFPELTAEYIYFRDCFFLALYNYELWIEDIYRDIPRLKGIFSIDWCSLKPWENAINKFQQEYCKVTGVAENYIHMENDNIKLAREIIYKKVNDFGILQETFEKEAELNEG